MSIDRRHSGTDLAPGLAVEVQQERRRESCMFEAEGRVDVGGYHSWCVSDRLSRRYRVLVESWRMGQSLSKCETCGQKEKSVGARENDSEYLGQFG